MMLNEGFIPPAYLGLNPVLTVASCKMSTDVNRLHPWSPVFYFLNYAFSPSLFASASTYYVSQYQSRLLIPFISLPCFPCHIHQEKEKSTKYLFMKDWELSCRVLRASFIAGHFFSGLWRGGFPFSLADLRKDK